VPAGFLVWPIAAFHGIEADRAKPQRFANGLFHLMLMKSSISRKTWMNSRRPAIPIRASMSRRSR